MPELPEVETVCRGLDAMIKNATITKVTLRRKDLRFPFPPNFAKHVAGRTIKSVTRRAKYLLFALDNGQLMLAHLGMSGRFSVETKSPKSLQTHDHVIFSLSDGRSVIYNDPRRFGLMTILSNNELYTHKLLAHLGPEPFSDAFNAKYLASELRKRKGAIKTALMDQTLVVGVGNIYASEALFLARIHPEKPALSVANKADLLIAMIRKVLGAAIESGGSSLRDFLHVSGEAGYFQHQFKVYNREGEPCFVCNIPLRGIRQAGRSTFYCESCQR